jgi:hypothetical protein
MYLLSFIFNILAAYLAIYYSRLSRLVESPQANNKPQLGRYRKIYKKTGLRKSADIAFYIFLPVLAFPVGIAVALITGYAGSLLLCVVPAVISIVLLKKRRNSEAALFQKNSYRIYKYVLNQISAGVRPSDALVTMYEVIDDKELKNRFSKACAAYSLTYDAVKLADDISEGTSSDEAKNLSMTIRDGLFESRDGDLLERLEQMMFNRYFTYIQKKTDSLKTRCLVTVVLLCMVIVAMILIPTVLDVQRALDSIFM